MNKSHIILASALCSLALTAFSQDTNALKTDIGVFEARTGVVIIKGFGPVGSVSAGTEVISVRCKESIDVSRGHKAYGLAIEIGATPPPQERIFVDYDEIDSLLGGINYLSKITYDVTSLPGFEASYTTRSGLRFAANSVRKQGGIQTSLQYGDQPRILLTSEQMTQLYGLIEQAKNNLDAIRTAKK
jgi:hypothetical protein